ncbi:DUF4347 domain-containing protein [Sulfurimonas sp. RIFOXYB12_FULL_35_9]|uniref:DUF4347 domain-containing protein n=1 Tax=Sulfurimonas sp. RIFOXYB12_FULL_35_9 TaxID=1802256 RepID=UPI0034520524
MTTNQNQISFIIDNITDYEAIASEISKTQSVHVLNSKCDILSQIASILEDYSNLDAIHTFFTWRKRFARSGQYYAGQPNTSKLS